MVKVVMGLNKWCALVIMVGILVALVIGEGVRQNGSIGEIAFAGGLSAVVLFLAAWLILRVSGWWGRH